MPLFFPESCCLLNPPCPYFADYHNAREATDGTEAGADMGSLKGLDLVIIMTTDA